MAKFTVGTDAGVRVITMEENAGTVYVRVDGLVVAEFNGEENALIVRESLLTEARVTWRTQP